MIAIRISRQLMRWSCLGVSTAVFLLLVACGSSPAEIPSTSLVSNNQPSQGAIVWGKVDSEPTDAILKWQPVVDYLAANLGDSGIETGIVKIAPDMVTMSRWVAAGEVDIVQDSFYPAMLVASNSGAVPLVIRNKDKSDRHAVFFARADAGLNSLEDLKGQTIALAEPHSTSGFMLPIAHLKQRGINPTEQPSLEAAAVASGDIGYIFSGDDDVAAQWVLNQTVIAGAVDNGTFEDFDEGNPGVLIVLDETEGITRNSMILARKDLDPALQENIRQVLLAMDQNPEGMAILEENGAVNFIQFQGESELVWARAQEMFQLIQD